MKPTLLFTFLCSGLIYAQDKPNTPATPEAKTKIEQFISKKGRVLIKTFEDVFEIPKYYSDGDKGSGSRGDVAVWEITDASSKSKIHGVKISLNVYNSNFAVIGQRSVFLDADEIESVIKGIDYLRSYDGGDTKYEDWQVDFKSKAGFQISAFNTSKGTQYAVEAGRVTHIFPRVEIEGLKEAFTKAKGLLGE